MSIALGRVVMDYYTNKSGGALAQGDVVIIDSSTAASVTTTTTAAYAVGSVGVVIDPNGIANDASGMVAITGPVPKITLSASASLGDLLKTHSVAKQAVPHAAPLVSGDFGQVLGTGTTPKAILWGAPKLAAGSGSFNGPGSSVAGNIVTFGDTSGAAGVDGGLPPAQVRIATVTLGSDAATIGFSSIPATYRALRAVFFVRGTQAAASIWSNGRLNNDSGGNYDLIQAYANNNAWSVATQNGATSFSVGTIAAASASAQYFTTVEIYIEQYANTSYYKNIDVKVNGSWGTSNATNICFDNCLWRSTAAVDRIDLVTAANFLTGSKGVLYGLT